MTIVVTGGTGFVGQRLVAALVDAGHRVILLTRNPTGVRRPPGVEAKVWDGETIGPWVACIDGADAVINFAGEPIAGGRWTVRRKRRIVDSRIRATRAIVRAIGSAAIKPRVLLNASAVGYYGSVPEGDVTEDAPTGAGFLADTCRMWEEEARRVGQFGVRVVLMRMGIVLGEGGGALEKMILPFRLFVGGPVGSGRQWFPWIHADDVVGAVMFALERVSLSGPVNLAAPEPATLASFCRTMGRVMGRPSWLRIPEWALKLLLGEMAGMLLGGQRIIPAQLRRSGYVFLYPELEPALRSILGKRRG